VTDAAGLVGTLEGIQVRLTSTEGGAASVVTDSSGTYAFTDLGDSTYFVSAYDGSATYKSGFFASGGLELTRDAADPVVLAGADATGIDLAMPIEETAAMSGSVTDASSSPVSGISVTMTGAYFPGLTGCDTTAADGEFEVPNLRAGAYRIRVLDPTDGFPSGFYSSSAPGHFTIDFAEATPVVIDGVDVPGLDIQFPQLYSVSGQVFDLGEAPVPDIQVAVCVPPIGNACRTAFTDGDGAYIVGGLVAGTYIVRTDGQGTLGAWYDGAGVVTIDPSEAEAVAVAGDVSGLNLTVYPAPLVSGHVTDAFGAPIPAMAVNLTDDEIGIGAGGLTDGNGDFSFALQPGTYVVRLDDSAFPPAQPSGYRDASGSLVADPAEAELITVGTADVPGVDVSVPQAATVDVGVTISGDPFAFGNVALCPTDSFCSVEAGTDESGSGSFPAVLPGEYLLRATMDFDTFWFHVDGEIATEDPEEASLITLTGGATASVSMTIQTAPPPAETPEGTDVEVALDDGTGATPVDLTFDNVLTAGITSLVIPESPPAEPAGFSFGDPPTYYEIVTSATFSGEIEVCITFDPGAYADPSGVRLLHFDDGLGAWDDITVLPVDAINGIVCGLTDGFSPFALAERNFAFGQFFGPKPPPTLNQATAGNVVGVQFTMAGGFIGMDLFAASSPSSQQIDCTTRERMGSSVSQTGTNSLKFSARHGRYTFAWGTQRSWRNTCRVLDFVFRDGAEVQVTYRFKK
jgi:hypothetical protein